MKDSPEDLTGNDLTYFSKYQYNVLYRRRKKFFLVTKTYWLTVGDHSRVKSINKILVVECNSLSGREKNSNIVEISYRINNFIY